MGIPVAVYKRKYDGRESRHFEGELVSQADGWLVVFSDASLHLSVKGGIPTRTSPYFVYFLSTVSPFVISFYFREDGSLQEAQCDIALPASMSGNVITFVDLEIDLIVAGDGSHYLRDFHEFAANRLAMNYPAAVTAMVRRASLEAFQMLSLRQFPWDGSAGRVLEAALAT